ncbi:uncharacterized protein LOC143858902 [Tasmannia lanceolata]|uniref:uncharacterized protein LOC143858902 n=1 Tax=Tasmannia lanceolata TaxID=3420 RepID=UPI0040643394
MSTQIRETITKCLAQAQSESDGIQHKALLTLSYLTKISPNNRNLLAQTNEAIPTLLALCTSSTTCTLALSILFNLSLNPNLRQFLAKTEAIQLLNSIIIAPCSPESVKLAGSFICSLAMLDKNKAGFGVAGTVQTLVKALGATQCLAAHHLLSSLAELVQFHGNCTLAVRAGAVPVLIQVVKITDGEDLAGSSLDILARMARFDEGIEAIRMTDGIVGLLVDVLKRRCMLSKEGSAEILCQLFDKREECVNEAVRFPEFSSLVNDLSIRGSSSAREKVGLLTRKMMIVNIDSYGEGSPMVL